MVERTGASGQTDGFGRGPSNRPENGIVGLTRAQTRALSRCAPLTPAEFKARRRAAEQGIVSLGELLGDPQPRA